MHPSDGILRTFADGEPTPGGREALTAHLAACERCRRRLGELDERSQRVGLRLAALTPEEAVGEERERAALAVLRARRPGAPDRPLGGLFSALWPPRPAWGIAAAVLLLATALGIPEVGAWTGRFLALFRVQKVQVVEVDPAGLERFSQDVRRLGPRLDRLIADEVTMHQEGEASAAGSAAEASRLAGFPVRLPAVAGGPARISVRPPATVTMRLDVLRLQSLLDEAGLTDLTLPAAIDGQTVRLDVPAAVTAAWGDCEGEAGAEDEEEGSGRAGAGAPAPTCTVLVELPSPVVTAPPELDVAALGEALLQVLGLTPDEARELAGTVDWTTTLVVPLPTDSRLSHRQVSVDGVPATLVSGPARLAPELRHYALLWVRDGIVHALQGRGDDAEALRLASSLGDGR